MIEFSHSTWAHPRMVAMVTPQRAVATLGQVTVLSQNKQNRT